MEIRGVILLFPLFFLIHEAEEIRFQRRWWDLHEGKVAIRFPRLYQGQLSKIARFSTAQFSWAVAQESVLVILATAVAVLGESYWFWTALVLAFTIHLGVHLLQALLWRGYVPGAATSLLALLYGVWAIEQVRYTLNYPWSIWLALTLGGCTLMVLNLRLVHAWVRRL